MHVQIRDVEARDDGTPPLHVAIPESARSAVIVVPEYWGLVDHIRDVTGRVAERGILAAAVDLFDGETTEDPARGRELSKSLDAAVAVQRIAAAAATVRRELLDEDAGVGVLGWCMGGGLAFRCARERLPLQAAIGFYGRPGDIDEIEASDVPTLGVFAEFDHVFEADAAREAATRLRGSGRPHRFVVASNARHGFFNDTRPDAYDEDSAGWAMELTVLWLRHFLEAEHGRHHQPTKDRRE